MDWLISGGCGFLGTALIRHLMMQGGHNVRVIDNLSVGSRDDLGLVTRFVERDPEQTFGRPADVELVVGDVTDADLALRVTSGCDVVVHFAANTGVPISVAHPRVDMMANVLGTFNYLEAARQHGAKKFIFASSGASPGEVEPPVHEELPAHPVSPYGASKLAGEGYCSAYKRAYGLDTVVLRFGNVYGPGSVHKSSVVAKFISRAISGEALEIYGDGSQTRDFIFIDDLIEAVLLAVAAPDVGGEVFQIASNAETTVLDMAQRLRAILSEAGLDHIQLVTKERRQGDVKRNYSDTTKARQRLGWQPRIGLNEGLRRTVTYFLNKRGVL
jgi:UDP-glucose 4-epimerase